MRKYIFIDKKGKIIDTVEFEGGTTFNSASIKAKGYAELISKRKKQKILAYVEVCGQ